MSSIERIEQVNFDTLLKLAFTDVISKTPALKQDVEDIYHKISILLDQTVKGFDKYGSMKIIYSDGIGRRYTGGVSLQTVNSTIRNALIGDFCFDIDIVNSCPSILSSLLKQQEFKAPMLYKYCDEREDLIKDVIKAFAKADVKVTRGQIKNLFNILVNNGSIKTWMTVHKFKNLTFTGTTFQVGDDELCSDVIDYIFDFQREAKAINRYVWNNADDFECDVSTKECEKKENPKGSFMSHMLFVYERKVINVLEKELKKVDLKVNAIVHDGLNVYHESMTKSDEVLKTLTKVMKKVKRVSKKKFNLDIDLLSKDMDTVIDVSSYKIKRGIFDQFDMKFMNSLKHYGLMKTYFEMFFGFVKASTLYYEISKTYCYSYDAKKLRERVNGIMYIDNNNNSEDEEKKPKRKDFLARYLSDVDRKQYDKTGVYIGNDVLTCREENVFNVYVPLPDVPEKPKKYSTYIDHYRRLIGYALGDPSNSKGYVDYFVQWLADMIRHPSHKGTSVSVVVSGDQGTGKSSLSEIMTWIFGKDKILSEASGRVLQDGFNGYLMGKMLFNLEESETKGDLTGRIKQFTTSSTWHYEFKNKNKVTAPNYARLLFVSNRKIPVYIDSVTGERRFVVFHSQAPTSETKAFFKKFYSVYGADAEHHSQFCKAVYNYLATVPITVKNFQEERPITEAYRKLMMRCVNKKIQFVIDFIEKCKFDSSKSDYFDDEDAGSYWELKDYNKDFKINKSMFFELFKMYMSAEYASSYTKINKSEFFSDLEKYFGIAEKRTKKERCLTFNPAEIMKVARNKNWIILYHGKPIKMIDIEKDADEDCGLDF